MKNAIYFDLDGTIADLYGVKGWLEDLRAEKTAPYIIAKSLVDTWALSKILNTLHRTGYHIGVISWTSKGGSTEYNERVAEAKKFWLTENIHFRFDEIKIVPFGTPKSSAVEFPEGILFDDEEPNRSEWSGEAHGVEAILETLASL